jgi:hypothetical protein
MEVAVRPINVSCAIGALVDSAKPRKIDGYTGMEKFVDHMRSWRFLTPSLSPDELAAL